MSLLKYCQLTCDSCISSFEVLDTGRISDYWNELRRLGWTRGDGKHFCPDCNKKEKETNDPIPGSQSPWP